MVTSMFFMKISLNLIWWKKEEAIIIFAKTINVFILFNQKLHNNNIIFVRFIIKFKMIIIL